MKKLSFQKVHNEKVKFQKAECLVKTVKKYFFKKAEYLADTYKSGSFRDKLPKMTIYIYIYIREFISYFFFFLDVSLFHIY